MTRHTHFCTCCNQPLGKPHLPGCKYTRWTTLRAA